MGLGDRHLRVRETAVNRCELGFVGKMAHLGSIYNVVLAAQPTVSVTVLRFTHYVSRIP